MIPKRYGTEIAIQYGTVTNLGGGFNVAAMLTDVVMPGMSGRELAERVQPLYPEIKVLYMSGYTDDTTVRHGITDRRINFIEKPFTPESLAAKVRKMLDAPTAKLGRSI